MLFNNAEVTESQGEIIIYQTDDGNTKIDVKIEDETVWLTQAQLVELYRTSKSNISEHISNIFAEGELDEDSVVRFFRTTAADGKRYNTKYYNLDMIISLGYRVKSVIATNFRKWATERISCKKLPQSITSPYSKEYGEFLFYCFRQVAFRNIKCT